MSAILGMLLWHCDAQGASNAFAEMKASDVLLAD